MMDLWLIYGWFMVDLWLIYGWFMIDLWLIYGWLDLHGEIRWIFNAIRHTSFLLICHQAGISYMRICGPVNWEWLIFGWNPMVLLGYLGSPNLQRQLDISATSLGWPCYSGVWCSYHLHPKSKDFSQSWWVNQPIWKISSNWIISPAVNIKNNIWNHNL